MGEGRGRRGGRAGPGDEAGGGVAVDDGQQDDAPAARLDDRFGARAVIVTSLTGLVVIAFAVFALHDGGKAPFWAGGLLLCAFVGPAQAASRSLLARVTPAGMQGEIFGLYATTGRVVSFLSPAAFGLFIWLGSVVTGQENTQYWGILGIVAVLFAGLVVVAGVKDAPRAAGAEQQPA